MCFAPSPTEINHDYQSERQPRRGYHRRVVAAAKRVRDELGGADILVNNAGVMLLAPFSSEQRGELRQMIEVNLLGAITTTEVFLDQLRDGEGDLINISSVAGRHARRATPATRRRNGA